MRDVTQAIQSLRRLNQELRKWFTKWDECIDNGAQPVAIQDIEYWMTRTEEIIKDLEDGYNKVRA